VTINNIHKLLLELQEEGYFIEDVLELKRYGVATEEDIERYNKGYEKISDFWFKIEFELFHILDGIPEEEYKSNLMLLMSTILEMRIEKLEFARMKEKRGIHWRTRKDLKKKINRRKYKNLGGMKPLETPDEILNTSDFVKAHEYQKTLPIGYETQWYDEIKSALVGVIDDLRYSYNLPHNKHIVESAVVKIYNKL
jgi:hypothetical protein